MEQEMVPQAPPPQRNYIFFNDRGLRAGWRLLIFCAILYSLFLPFRLLARLAPAPPPRPQVLTPVGTIIGDSVLFLVFLLVSFIMSKIEKRSMGSYGLPLAGQPVLKRFVNGFVLWGFLPLTLVLLIMKVCNVFSFGAPALHGPEILSYGALWAVAFTLVGFAEEYMLRGYALFTLADGIGYWPAALFMAVLFGIGHSFNTGETRIGIIATVVFAMVASAMLRYTGSLWLAVGSHAGWDWAQSYFYGVSDSGIPAQGHFLEPSFHGPVWLTGGSVGPEGSIVALCVWVLLALVVVIVYRKREAPVIMMKQERAPLNF